MEDYSLNYKPNGEVLKRFLLDSSFFCGIRGPIGSGKSVASCIKLLKLACEQKPGPDGIRRSRWAVVRNTYPQLRTTTIKTWLEWVPEAVFGKFRWSVPFTHHLKFGDVDAEIFFLALDRPEDVRKLLSLELTGAFINEAREVPKTIVDALTSRVGRYPPVKDGGPTWHGVFADTNAPDEDHWWPLMAGEVPIPDHMSREDALMLEKPENWKFFTQPGGMWETRNDQGELVGYEPNPRAENTDFLLPSYYPDLITGKSKSWIDVYVLNRLGTLVEGKSVYPDFREEVHVAREPIEPIPDNPVYVGIDFGLTPAAVFAQKLRGRWLILDEIVATDMGMVKFADLLIEIFSTRFMNNKIMVTGDPAGDQRAQTDETTPFQILKAAGINARPAPSNDISVRIEAVRGSLNRMVDGMTGMLVDSRCKQLIRGFEGGYQYKRLQMTKERYEDKPDKNSFSHVHDALQYCMLGAGEAKRVLNRGVTKGGKIIKAQTSFNPFERAAAKVRNFVR